ncbi:MarR family winged helix-turn-helix transcriptional regulator [Ferdinandcohnia quinoae]|uniref:MarR family winged helix-turn-helix transcriptional regulator n=1 Tax=Fredinandcohnia quinoae TaxID=2918902 RepID=A0AAW5ECK6_9BACI|nr:MarR family winged helix-turn-helix transcriptional regulator [Fredinandcohnia sp. SECRCQ15]MCH1626898.1 MarR family winged helix-turn-helix transcriptional regulator [Fredinandcohnia sp. SECRCQ15]
MENLREIFQVMTRRFGFLNKNCCSIGGCDISLIQSHILYEIDQQHNPSMQQIAETLGTDITTFSRQVQSLVKMKLVKKTPDTDDRRIYILSLTTEGKFIATSIDEQMNTFLNEVFSHMNEFEKETVIRSIRLLNDAMEKSSMCCAPLG